MSMYLSRPVLAGFEYRACISRYLKAEHSVSDRFLARFVHSRRCYGVQQLTKAVAGAIAANLRSLFRGLKLPKLDNGRLTLPAISLSVGSKLELLSSSQS